MSNYETLRAAHSSKENKTTRKSKHGATHILNDTVGDGLMDSYPDRNPNESGFPHLAPSVGTPALHEYYQVIRDRIIQAIQLEIFRNGHFKGSITAEHGSVGSIILEMQLSGEVSKAQHETLRLFGRVWSIAIGRSKVFGNLDEEFISQAGLAVQAEKLFDMFEEEKLFPNPYPLPHKMKYKDPVTMRREIMASFAKDEAEKLRESRVKEKSGASMPKL